MDTEPSYSCDAELDDEIIGKALSSPQFIQEREEPADLRQASKMTKFCCQLSPFHPHKYGESRIRIKFKSVSKMETKSRLGKRANQDSP